MIDEPLVFEVRGRTVVVESSAAGWRAHVREQHPDRDTTHDIRIPAWIRADELPRFLSSLFEPEGRHGSAEVRRVW